LGGPKGVKCFPSAKRTKEKKDLRELKGRTLLRTNPTVKDEKYSGKKKTGNVKFYQIQTGHRIGKM